MPPRNPEDREQRQVPIPELEQHEEQQEQQALATAPAVEVLGKMDANYIIRTGWTQERHAVSPSRLKFLSEVLGMDVTNDPDNYVL